MTELTVPPALLLVPLLLLGAAAGLRRGWGPELVTGLALAGVLLGFDLLVRLVLAVLRVVARIITEVARAGGLDAPDLARQVDALPRWLVAVALALAFVAGAYALGRAVGGAGGSRRWRLGGATVGGLNALLVIAIATARAQEILGAARLRRLLLLPGAGRGVSFELPPLPGSGALAGWSAYAVVALVLMAFVWGVTRLGRLRGE